MLGPNGGSYTEFPLYRMGDGYTKINTGFSGSNMPGEKTDAKERWVKQGREMGESE